MSVTNKKKDKEASFCSQGDAGTVVPSADTAMQDEEWIWRQGWSVLRDTEFEVPMEHLDG